jgi:Holliday junction resolvase
MANFKEHVRGAIASNVIANYLMSKGYEVIKEGTSQGLVDIVAINTKTGKTYFVDCKCLSRRANGTRVNRILKQAQKDLSSASGIDFILAYADTDTNEVEIPKLT